MNKNRAHVQNQRQIRTRIKNLQPSEAGTTPPPDPPRPRLRTQISKISVMPTQSKYSACTVGVETLTFTDSVVSASAFDHSAKSRSTAPRDRAASLTNQRRTRASARCLRSSHARAPSHGSHTSMFVCKTPKLSQLLTCFPFLLEKYFSTLRSHNNPANG